MIPVVLTDECKSILNEFGVDEGWVGRAVNNRHATLTDRAPFRMICGVHWLDEDRVLFFSGEITKRELIKEEKRIHIQEVTVPVALKLTPELPAGVFEMSSDMETILAIVAESWGIPVRCHPDEPYSTLYSGPAVFDPSNPRAAFINIRDGEDARGDVLILGSCRPDEGFAQYFWAFSLDKYRQWMDGLRNQ